MLSGRLMNQSVNFLQQPAPETPWTKGKKAHFLFEAVLRSANLNPLIVC